MFTTQMLRDKSVRGGKQVIISCGKRKERYSASKRQKKRISTPWKQSFGYFLFFSLFLFKMKNPQNSKSGQPASIEEPNLIYHCC